MDHAEPGKGLVVHCSTLVANAALEGKGATTAFISNRGLKDILCIGRQARAKLYNLTPTQNTPPVPIELCFETGGRLTAQAELIDYARPAALFVCEQLAVSQTIIGPAIIAEPIGTTWIDVGAA